MLLLLILFISNFATVLPAELHSREVIGITVEAGGLIGTGAIEFKSAATEVGVNTKATSTVRDVGQATTEICQATVVPEQDKVFDFPSLEKITPKPMTPITTSHQSPSNRSNKSTSSPTNIPMVSSAVASGYKIPTSVFGLAVMSLYMVVF